MQFAAIIVDSAPPRCVYTSTVGPIILITCDPPYCTLSTAWYPTDTIYCTYPTPPRRFDFGRATTHYCKLCGSRLYFDILPYTFFPSRVLYIQHAKALLKHTDFMYLYALPTGRAAGLPPPPSIVISSSRLLSCLFVHSSFFSSYYTLQGLDGRYRFWEFGMVWSLIFCFLLDFATIINITVLHPSATLLYAVPPSIRLSIILFSLATVTSSPSYSPRALLIIRSHISLFITLLYVVIRWPPTKPRPFSFTVYS